MRLQLFAKRTVAALVVRSKIQIQLQGVHIMSYASKLKKSLFQCIETLNQRRNEYCHSPGKDYTRNRKADFSSIIKAVLCLGGKSLNKELYEIFGFSPDTLTPSAFIQQRSKIKPEAFKSCSGVLTAQISKFSCFTAIVCSQSTVHFYILQQTKWIRIHCIITERPVSIFTILTPSTT